MTIFKIPEGKVVDSIEFEEWEGKATINVIYKEEKPKQKDVMVLVETEGETWLYRHKETGTLMRIVGPLNHPENYIPLRQAEAGEFVVIQQDSLRTANTKVESCLSTCVCPGHAIDVAWRELNELFVEPK